MTWTVSLLGALGIPGDLVTRPLVVHLQLKPDLVLVEWRDLTDLIHSR